MTLKNRLLLFTIPASILAILSVYLIVRLSVHHTVSNIENNNTKKLLEMAMLSIRNQYNSLQYHKEYSFEQRKAERKEMLEIALMTLEGYYNAYQKGELTKDQAKSQAIDHINRFRYDNGNGYIWINNTERPIPRIIVHPFYPEFNNKISSHPMFFTSADSNNIPKLALDLCEEKGGGFIEYYWPKPTKPDANLELPKLSYVKPFEPWQWVLGTGVYIEDIETDVQQRLAAILEELKQTVGQMKITENGYFFIFNSLEELLLHPILSDRELDSTFYSGSSSPMKDIMDAASRSEGILEYVWNNPRKNDASFIHEKKVYFQYFEPLDWYVCASIYKKEIEAPASLLSRQILIFSLIFLIIALLVSVKLSESLARPLRNLMNFVVKIPSMKEGLDVTKIPISGSVETRSLSIAIRNMLVSIEEQKNKLLKAKYTSERSRLKLKESEERYRFMVENGPTVFWMFEQGGRARYLSPNVGQFLGFTSEDFYEQGVKLWISRINDEDKPQVIEAYQNLFSNDKKYDETYRIQTRTGKWLWVHSVGDKNSDVYGGEVAYGIATDITEKKISEQQVLNAMIQSEEKERSRIAKDLHDGVSPLLSAIKLFTQSMRDNKDEKIRNELSAKISVTIKEAIQSINEISTNISPHILEYFGLSKAVESFMVKLLSQLPTKYSVDSKLEERLPAQIETTMYRISTELINNTVKHANADLINIKYWLNGSNVVMEYQDDGKGFDFDETIKSKNGMGLFNMKNRINSLNGHIEFKSEINSGTKVIISVPLN